MAKCSICNSRKGKRKCRADETFICSLCCGQSRNHDKCNGCSFYKDAAHSRNYRKVPFYEILQMSDSLELQDISNAIESTLCALELESEESFTDKIAARLIELYLDKYHFKDPKLTFNNNAIEVQFYKMSKIFEQELLNIQEDQFLKVLASVYRSIQRRTNGGKEYLRFAQQYVGVRVESGMRVLPREYLEKG